jgi:hypothetical protein
VVGYQLYPKKTFVKEKIGKYAISCVVHITPKILLKSSNNCALLFRVNDGLGGVVLQKDGNKMWDAYTNKEKDKTSSHMFLILCSADSAVIVQGYFGHYTIHQWCDFDKPLEQIPTPPPHSPNWYCKINPAPEFRGILSYARLRTFYETLFSLTKKSHDHSKAYADITGVLVPPSDLVSMYKISYMRVNLRQILYNH